MFSALKRLTGRGDAPEQGAIHQSHQTMSANLQRKFAKGVQYNMKIIIKGDRNVGKTCLFHRLQGKKFVESYSPTEEIQVASIHWNYKATDDIVKVEVWDVVDKGKKKKTFDGLKLDNAQLEIPEEAALDAEFLDVYKNANGVILVMDITKSWTFNYIQRELPKIPPHIPIMILANHCDMSHHRTVTPHHLTFYVENLQRGPDAAQVRCCESSMRNGFGLKILHKFFNLPFLQLQKDTLLKQLQTNKNETELTINELDLYMESDDADYNKFLDRLVQKRRIVADSAQPAHLQTSQSFHQLQQQNVGNSLRSSQAEPEIKHSKSFNDCYKIGPIGGGHPISVGLHKTAIGVGNPHSKILGPNFNLSDVISHSPGDSRSEQVPQTIETNVVGKSKQIVSDVRDGGGFISKLFGKTKENSSVPSDVKSNVTVDSIANVDEFIPDDCTIDRSFLEDTGQETMFNNIEQESDSDEEFGNPLVSGFQDDLDPDDFTIVKNPYDDSLENNRSYNNSCTNISLSRNSIENKCSSQSNGSVNEIGAKLNSVSLTSSEKIKNPQNEARLEECGVVSDEDCDNHIVNVQTYDITGEALDSWFNCDSKQRRSPEGGEDNFSDCRKAKDDVDSQDSFPLNDSTLIVSSGKREKTKKKEKDVDGKTKKNKKKSSEKSREKSKNSDKKRKKVPKADGEDSKERNELEEFLSGPFTTVPEGTYEAF